MFKYFFGWVRVELIRLMILLMESDCTPSSPGKLVVAVCERVDQHTFKPVNIKNPIVIAIPENANAQSSMGNDDLFYNNLINKLNGQGILKIKT